MSEKVKRSIENFELALKKLNEYLSTPVVSDRDRSGVIQAFEFTFELTWKTLQKLSDDEGLEVSGPKSALKNGFKLGLISSDEEAIYLAMLEDRNLMTHTYREELSKEIFSRIESSYTNSLNNLLKSLKN
jgi:nucleotidyltransferase substrate binding protein (TIGR01987 family)